MTILELYLIMGIIGMSGFMAVLLFMLLYLKMKTPAFTIWRNKVLGVNPLPNKKMEIMGLDGSDDMASSKKRGHFFINPDHFYIESKSGKPIALMPSIIGKTVDIKKVMAIEKLKKLGITNFDQLREFNALYGKCSCGYEGRMVPAKREGHEGYVLECPESVKEGEDGNAS